ncbi:MAG: PAS domain-containing protein [Geothrix sp.]|jgi:PAS domain S-box-containing protein|uniref:histidine kinase n=1 Tax=Candidatus Geothrix odensensis TaxID=2954440 RepID=A0A936F396_9BACT|nr:PAS domain-containing protein [Candidatus Geothrix odensensis]MCC6514624.1 PAS domain-containing protein [Geothrix sp.]
MSEPIQIHPKGSASSTAGALRVVFLYAGFSGLWILLSDRVVAALFQDPAAMTLVSILKGWFFVAVTAIMLFVMVRRLVDKVASREARLQSLLRAIPDLVWLKDPEGVYLGCNRAFERFFGAKEAAILGKTDHDFVSREQADFFRQKDREVLAAGETRVNEEWVTLAETGQKILLETLKTPMYDVEGRLTGVLGIGRDITEHHRMVAEQSRLESQLQQAQKMELVGRFAGSVAHDYNNMLGVILANADLALYQMPQVQAERKYLEEIQRAARHSANLTRQLLAFARRQPVEPCLLDLNSAVTGMRGVLGRLVGPEIQLAWTAAPGLWEVRMDPTQLDQVLTNLVVNARDAITGRGRIEVVTANRSLDETDCATLPEARPGDHVCLSVADSGCGMAPELAERIFEPFFTTKPAGRGTGLGLATVHGIVKQNHGVIQVESEPGKGTTFRVYFPRA